MSSATGNIEQIVREVLRRLESQGTPADPEAEPETLRINERLVTLATVAGRLTEVRRLVVRPRAVVTPAVQDELRRRGVRLERAEPATVKPAGERRLLAVVAVNGTRGEMLLRAAEQAAPHVERLTPASDSHAAIDALTSEIERGGKGLLITDRPAAAVCYANRHETVRAASADDPTSVREAIQTMDANLLVVDSRRPSLHTLRAMVREFLK